MTLLIRVSKNRLMLFLTTLAITICLTSCMKAESSSAAAAEKNIKTFASPQEAAAALLQAAKSGDQAALLAIFGPDGKDVLFTGDSETDKNALQDFAEAYEMMNRWGKIDAGGEMLYVGAENFRFPIPLQENSAGRWYFKTAAGADEVQTRRIGKDELVAMAALQGIANAQQQYFNQPQGGQVQQYAQKFASDQGKHDGLYWPASKGQSESPLGQMGDFAKGIKAFKAGMKEEDEEAEAAATPAQVPPPGAAKTSTAPGATVVDHTREPAKTA